jgi:hypothetical protein
MGEFAVAEYSLRAEHRCEILQKQAESTDQQFLQAIDNWFRRSLLQPRSVLLEIRQILRARAFLDGVGRPAHLASTPLR